MSKIFWGFFFIVFHFNLTLGTSVISLLPDFIGYFLILSGIYELENLASSFGKVKSWVLLLALLKIVTFLLDLAGLSSLNQPIAVIIGIVLLVISLYVQYYIIYGIRQMEESQQMDLYATKLFSLWKIVATCSIFSYLCLILSWLAAIFIIISVLADIVFIYYLWQSKKNFEENMTSPPPF